MQDIIDDISDGIFCFKCHASAWISNSGLGNHRKPTGGIVLQRRAAQYAGVRIVFVKTSLHTPAHVCAYTATHIDKHKQSPPYGIDVYISVSFNTKSCSAGRRAGPPIRKPYSDHTWTRHEQATEHKKRRR